MSDPNATPPPAPISAGRTRRARPPVDPELTALSSIVTILDTLSVDARQRVTDYVMNRVNAVAYRRPAVKSIDLSGTVTDNPAVTLTDVAMARVEALPSGETMASVTPQPHVVRAPEPERKLPAVWLAETRSDVVIRDRDGWSPEQWEIPCTEADFHARLMACTIERTAPPVVAHDFEGRPAAVSDVPPVNPFARMPGFPALPPPPARAGDVAPGGAA